MISFSSFLSEATIFDLSKLVFKAMLGGALASWLTASIAGIMIPFPKIGDVNYDKEIDLKDKEIIERHLIYEELSYADIDKDGLIGGLYEVALVYKENKVLNDIIKEMILPDADKNKVPSEALGLMESLDFEQFLDKIGEYELIGILEPMEWDTPKVIKLKEKLTKVPEALVKWQLDYSDVNEDGKINKDDLEWDGWPEVKSVVMSQQKESGVDDNIKEEN